MNEEVYLLVTGQDQPAGPYRVTAILADHYYNLKRGDNGQLHPQSVREEDLVVRVS